MKVIYDLNGLRDSKFGQPDPRHGLELLYWFSREYIDIDVNKRMKPKQERPQNGAFGFCLFHNIELLLPKRNLPYYEVGNLSKGANKLPWYVSKKYTHQRDGSNKDRIIIALKKSDIIEMVYLTEHYKPYQTYEVKQSVIEQIRKMELEQFLGYCSNNQSQFINQATIIDMSNTENLNQSNINPQPNTSRCWCTIL